MTDGGGTPVIAAATEKWRGAGHEAVFRDGGREYLLFHAYDGVTGAAAAADFEHELGGWMAAGR